MKKEQFEKAELLLNEIQICNENIARCKYTQNPDVVERQSYLNFLGIDDAIYVPPQLFRIIGKLILAEHQQHLLEIQSAFDAL